MRRFLVLLLLTASCSRRDEVRPDPVVVKPAPPAPKPAAHERMMVAGVLVDLEDRKILHTLSKLPPTFEELDDSSAFLVDRAGEVHAFDLATGDERWHQKPVHCTAFTMTAHEVFCLDDTHVRAFAKKDGAVRTIAGTKPVQQILGIDDRLVVLRTGGVLETWTETGSAPAATDTTLFHTWPRLQRHAGGFCGATSVMGGVSAGCWGADLSPRWSSTFPLSKPGEPATTWYAREIGPDFLVVSTWYATKVDRGLVVRLSDGKELARVEESLANVVSHDGKTLDGLLPARGLLRLLDPSGKPLWTSKSTAQESSVAASLGGRLFLAEYSPIATGTVLFAFDTSPTPTWATSATLPPIAHSAYANHVDLRVVNGAVAMHGEEAAVEYLSLFEPNTGKPLFDVVRMLW